MLLESITLENFRQFRHESIDFAQGDNGKNVTIIIGENGTGKTTFAQAFFWCMYGETEFSDKNMLNKLVAAEMKPGQESKVQVILKLRHGTVNYTLMREQTYRKDYSNRVKGDNTVFDIAIKDANGKKLFVVRNKFWHKPFYKSALIFQNGKKLATVQNSHFIKNGYEVTGATEEIKVEGKFWNLDIMLGDKKIGHIAPPEKMTLDDAYTLEVEDPEDAPFLVAMMIAIDNIHDQQRRGE